MRSEQPQAQSETRPQSASTRQPSPAPQPALAPARQSRLTKFVAGAAIVGALAFGAVATGFVHIPGFDSGGSVPQVTSVTPINAEPSSEGDRTYAGRFATLTPEIAKARQLATTRSAGVLVIEAFSNGPLDHAGIRANDVIIAMDGVPIRQYSDVTTKIRMTPIGQTIAVTFERSGSVHDSSVTIARCLARELPKAPGTDPACERWTE